MRYLLDTHVLAWAVGDPNKLSKTARRALENPRHERLVSAVSIWEMSIKFSKGKWPEVESFMDEQQFQEDLTRLRATELPVRSRDTRVAGLFSQAHQDPFDRLLAAQAILEAIPIISKDDALDAFPINRIW
jgi:PIN domain nuclease of toxin-antitoxin system